MHSHVRSSVIAGVAVAGIGALAVAPLAPPPESYSPPTAVHEVRLAATAAPPLGAIPLAFIRNQFDYCSVICPDVVRLAITVPAGAALSPAAFLGTLQTTGSLTRSIGAAAASVTGPANAAFTPIIRNDLNIVLPKAQRGLQVALVQGIRVGSTVGQVGDVVGAVQTARIAIVDALNQPKGPPAASQSGALRRSSRADARRVRFAGRLDGYAHPPRSAGDQHGVTKGSTMQMASRGAGRIRRPP